MLNVVVFCGGRGSSSLVRELSKRSSEFNTTLIINPYDDGKSTGELRKLIPGLPGISDFRKNIVNASPLAAASMLELRVSDFAIGNGLIASLYMTGISFQEAIDKAAEMYKVPVKLVSVTNSPAVLSAKLSDGTLLPDEASIAEFDGRSKIVDLKLNGVSCTNPDAVLALQEADVVIFGAGTQHSSLLPSYLTLSKYGGVDLEKIKAKKILVVNLRREGDTVGWTYRSFIESANKYWSISPENLYDKVILDRSSDFADSHAEMFDCVSESDRNLHDGKKLIKIALDSLV